MRAAAERLLPQARAFCRLSECQGYQAHSQGPSSRERIIDVLQSIDTGTYTNTCSAADVDKLATVAEWVDPDRAALPKVAGGVRPAEWLCGERAAVLRDLDRLKQPTCMWPELPRPCHKVGRWAERQLLQRLLDSGLARLVPASEVPRDPLDARWWGASSPSPRGTGTSGESLTGDFRTRQNLD